MAKGQLGTVLRQIRQLSGAQAHADLTDGQLLRRFVGHRDEAAFAALVERHGGLVLGVCRRVLLHEQDAEDAFQAAFLILARKSTAIRKIESMASWLHGVAQRTAMNLRKSAMRRRKHEQATAQSAAESPVAGAALKELQALLDAEVARLPDRYRAPFVLCCLEGKSRPEAAHDLGWKLGTVSSRLSRARQRLKQQLTRRGVVLSAALCATALADNVAAAAVPPTLASSTTKAALHFAAGKLAVGFISERTAALTEGVLRAMFVSKLKKTGLVLALALTLALGGLGALHFQEAAAETDNGASGPLPQAAAVNPAKEKSHLVQDKKDEAAGDLEKLQGHWEVVETERDGKKVQEDDIVDRCVISKNNIVLERMQILDRKDQVEVVLESVIGTLALETNKVPKRMIIEGEWSSPLRDKKVTYYALYKIDGDTLTILLPPPRTEPPAEFKTTAGLGQQLQVFKRQTPSKEQPLNKDLSVKIVVKSKLPLQTDELQTELVFTNEGQKPLRLCTLVGHTGSRTDAFDDMTLRPDLWKSEAPPPERSAKEVVTLKPGQSVAIARELLKIRGAGGKFEIKVAYEVGQAFGKKHDTWVGRVEAEPVVITLARQLDAAVREIDLKGLQADQPKGAVLKPTKILNAKQLAKAFPDKSWREKIQKQVDFAKEQLLFFAWAGAIGDKLTFSTEEGKNGPVVVYWYSPSPDLGLAFHFHLYAVAKEASWRINDPGKNQRKDMQADLKLMGDYLAWQAGKGTAPPKRPGVDIAALIDYLVQMPEGDDLRITAIVLARKYASVIDLEQQANAMAAGDYITNGFAHERLYFSWKVLLATGVLREGLRLEAACAILGQPTKINLPSYAEWHYRSSMHVNPCMRCKIKDGVITAIAMDK
jgi:RNA polymerase sigma factor (sigma-70 family)